MDGQRGESPAGSCNGETAAGVVTQQPRVTQQPQDASAILVGGGAGMEESKDLVPLKTVEGQTLNV